MDQQKQDELLRLQQTALAEKQREEQELFCLQQEALLEKQREEEMRQRMAVPPPVTVQGSLPAPVMPPGMEMVTTVAVSMASAPLRMVQAPISMPPPPGIEPLGVVPPGVGPPGVGPPGVGPPGVAPGMVPPGVVPPGVVPPGVVPPGVVPPGVAPPGVGPPGVDPDEDPDQQLPSLLSMHVEPPSDVKEVKLPIALEQALAFKTERAKQVGVEPDEIQENEIPEPPPAPIISTSSLRNVYEGEDEEDEEEEDEEDEEEEYYVEEENQRLKEKMKLKLKLIKSEQISYYTQQPAVERQSKNKRKKKRKKRAKFRQQVQQKVKEEGKKKSDKETGEKEPDVEIEYIQETLGLNDLDPMYRQFARIFETFRISEPEKLDETPEVKKEPVKEPDLKKVPKLEEDFEEEEEEEEKKEEEKTKLSKRKMKKLTRLSVAELKQLVSRPDVVEMHDVTARDPKLLVQLKAHRNTVPVPRHWCFKRKYLQGKRGIEKPPFDLPDFIKKTGIMEMRAALQEKEDQRTLKAKMRERARPKLGKIDIDYQKLHDAFFKWQTKPRMSIHGDLYYEGKEFETRLKEKKPGDLTEELRTALGMPVGPNAHKVPPPWLIAMQRYGPPPSYPNLKIPGLNAPIPDGCSFGYHAGGWGKPPVDETGRPLYGDVFGLQSQDSQANNEEEEVDRTTWGELESESEEESEDEDEDEDEEERQKEDETGLVTPAEGLITPSGITSIPAGLETPEIIELRKRKIESEMEGGETPVLYQVLPEKRVDRVGGAMMASTHIYDMTAAGAQPPPGGQVPRRHEGPGTVELALDPSELDLVDTEAMAVRYEQQIREQQSQLQKEDLSDMLADHVARQKNKRKQRQQHQDNKQAKKYKEFKF